MKKDYKEEYYFDPDFQPEDDFREELREHGVGHVTVELENPGEVCPERECHVEPLVTAGHHHHHH